MAFLFTFGPLGPYLYLYKYVPGFDGLRVPARFHVFVMFSLAIFAAHGVKRLLSGGGIWKTVGAKAALALLVLVEYASMPLPMKTIPIKKEIPEVYRWLATQGEDFALLELPLSKPDKPPAVTECERLYYSIYHWKKLVNGYSGYFPPLYDELRRRWKELSFDRNIADLQALGVRFIIVHASDLTKKEIQRIIKEWEVLGDEVRTIGIFENDYVMSVRPKAVPERKSVRAPLGTPLPREGWRVTSNVNQKLALFAVDGSLDTRWDSGPQKSGVSITIDLKKPELIRGLSMNLGTSPLDYPRGYRVEVSEDGMIWEQVAGKDTTVFPILDFLAPKNMSVDISFLPKKARWVRTTETGDDPIYYWSIYEIEVYR